MVSGYIKAHTFDDVCINQEHLIEILNHRMTKMEQNMYIIKNDVGWTKKILWGIFGVISAAFIMIMIQAAVGAS